jgi:glycosyltransferase involved in cell wall biosynthesis
VPTLSAALAGKNLARRLGAKSVSDIQDAWPEAFSRILPKKLKFLSSFLFLPMRLMAKALYRSSDMLSGVSSAYGKLTGRNDYYLSRLGISVKSLPKKNNPSSRRISRLVYVGSLGIGYDLETVIDALKIDSSLSLDIAGEGERKEAICRYSEKCGVSERVRFHGWLGAEELSSLISSCDAGIIPMSDESMVALPNKFFDYLSSSLPVITSLHGECAEILLGENMGAIYEEKSAQSFLRAVESLRLNPPKHVFLSDSLRADKIYPKFVREVEKSLLENNRR